MRRKSTRKRKQTNSYKANLAKTEFLYVNVVTADSPKSYKDMINRKDADLWHVEMDKEMDCILKNKNTKWLIDQKILRF